MKTNVKNIPYGRQNIIQDDIDQVISVLKSDFLTQGPAVPKFEKAIQNKVGANFSCATNSATSALHVSCLALGVQKNDLVWTSPNSFVASSNAAIYCGAMVDFVDIDPLTLNMCVETLQEKLENAKKINKLPKVVIPVHFGGLPVNMKRIFELSQEYKFKIIEDASHALGAFYTDPIDKSKYFVGSCTHSDITVFSFHPIKMITTAEGGMAITNDPELSRKLHLFRSHGITADKSFFHDRPEDEIWNYQQLELGYNYRMNDIQASLGISQLKRLDYFLERRRKIATNYNLAVKKLPVNTQLYTDSSSYHLYCIIINELLTSKDQKSLFKHLYSNHISANLHYIPIYLQPYYRKLGFKAGYCPNSESYYKGCVSLPIFPQLSTLEFDHVINTLKSFFE